MNEHIDYFIREHLQAATKEQLSVGGCLCPWMPGRGPRSYQLGAAAASCQLLGSGVQAPASLCQAMVDQAG